MELFGVVKETLAGNIREVKDMEIHDVSIFDLSNSRLFHQTNI